MGANYTAGDLNVSILGDSIHAEKGIDNIIRKLDSLQKALTVFNTVNAQGIGANLSQTFTQISNAVNSIDVSNISKLSTLSTAINPLKNFINTVKNIDTQSLYGKLTGLFRALSSSANSIDSSVSAKFQELGNASASFRTFINAMNRVGKIDATKIATNLTSIFTALSTSLNSIDSGTIAKLQQIGNASQGLSALKSLGYARTGGNGKGKSSGFGLYNILRFTYVIYLARRLGNIVGDILKKGADYVETLNLWETAMKDNVSQATEFVNKMNEAYGISKKTLMNAQAVFKNMIGTLGGVSEEISYKLSEGITQMAVDYASLFNVNFEQAFIRFQSALAGQVRPIRSIAGFDITENTLFELYKTLGGTKTVRQLTITEKRLLAIYAIFKQMQSSGAIGDLSKTMNSFANQSRVMAEAWQEMWSYAGLIITHLIEQSGLMTKINGLLIFFGNVLEAVADNMGAIKSFGVSIFEDTENSAYNASDAVDELKGKLLDFDKFRVMNSNEENEVVLDETILNAIAGYDTILQNAKLAAQEFAKYLGEASGLFDENGIFQPQRWEEITQSIEELGLVLETIIISATLTSLIKGIKNLSFSLEGMSNLLIFGVVLAILKAIDAFEEGDIVTGVIATTIAVVLVGALVALKIAQYNAIKSTKDFNTSLATNDIALNKNALNARKTAISFNTMVTSLAALAISYSVVTGLLNLFPEGEARNIASWCAIVVGGIMALVAALVALKSTQTYGVALPVLLAGVGMAVAGVQALVPKPEAYAVGASNIDSGTLFIAGESGKTETVFNGSNGRTNVANIQQMKSAFYQALVEYGKTQNNSQPIVVTIDGQEVFYATRKVANQNGLDFSNVR